MPVIHSSIQSLLEHLHPVGSRSHRGLTLVPLFAPTRENPPYITLSAALRHEGFRITEISEGGSVPDLRVINRTPHNVFLLDGQELKGAKQNRVLNTSILVPAESEIDVPVSCTEQGRWSYDSPEFTDSQTVMSAKIRKTKSIDVAQSLHLHEKAAANQGKVWDEIEKLHADADTGHHSPTRAMKDAYDAHRRGLAEFIKVMPCVPNQSGLLAILRGRVEGLDVLSRPAAYAEIHESLVRSHAMDALVRREPHNSPPVHDPENLAHAFLEEARQCEESVHDSPGLGQDHRLRSAAMLGSALVAEKTTVHLALFRNDRSSHGRPDTLAARRRRAAREAATAAERDRAAPAPGSGSEPPAEPEAPGGQHSFPLRLANGHLFVSIDGQSWLVATGAPTSFGLRRSLRFCGRRFSVGRHYLGLTPTQLAAFTGIDAVGMLGADVLNEFDHLFDLERGCVTVSPGPLSLDGTTVPMREIIGLPVVRVHLEGRKYPVFFDTSSPVSYFQDRRLERLPAAGPQEDFFPGLGRFESETHTGTLTVGDLSFPSRFGRLPDLLANGLRAARTRGILGNELLQHRTIGYFPKRRRLVV
jgi:hypothetical protein